MAWYDWIALPPLDEGSDQATTSDPFAEAGVALTLRGADGAVTTGVTVKV